MKNNRLFRKVTIFFLLVSFSIFNIQCKFTEEKQRQEGIGELKDVNVNIAPMIIHYKGTEQKDRVIFSEKHARDIYGNKWLCKSTSNDNDDYIDLDFRFEIEEGLAKSTGVGVKFSFQDWNSDNYVFVPAAVYNGNRFRVLDVPYPPGYKNDADRVPELPITITNVPHLNLNGSSKLELTTGDAATPCGGFYFPSRKKGILVFMQQENRLGNYGITIKETSNHEEASFVISSPVVREYRATGTQLEKSDDKAPDWEAGQQVNIKCRIYLFDAPGLQTFYDKFFNERKTYFEATAFQNFTPFSKAMSIQEELQNSLRWYEEGGYYKNGNGDSPFGHIQLGWVGGLMQTYPLLLTGDNVSQQRALKTIDVILNNMQGKSGFLFGTFKDGKLYDDDIFNNNDKPGVAMIRKNADGLYFLLKQILLLESRGEKVNPKWKSSARKWADAFVVLWRRYNQFGQLIDPSSGEIVVGGSTAGAMAPAALSIAGRYFNNKEYIEVAKAAATLYYERDVKRGYTTGGPGEILQCPDSESAFALLESFIVLYETTSDKIWIERAEDMATLCSSWVVSYDYQFPEKTILAKRGANTTGVVWASVQNKHAAPGICTSSGNYLLKLYRATGNEKYLELLQDIAHNIIQFMSTEKQPVGNNKNGYINERINMSDWEGFNDIGNPNRSSVSWCETAVMLTCVEIPGIYIISDKQKVFCFDHVKVEKTKENKDGFEIEVTNNTPYSANVNILSEPSDRLLSNLDYDYNLKYFQVSLSPDERKTLFVLSNGELVY